jgi:hypothetical protein
MSQVVEFSTSAGQCASLFRLGRDVEAAVAMVDLFAQCMSTFDGATASMQQQWAQTLMSMLDCQERQDWLSLADFLEYEVVELLRMVEGR